MLFVAAVWDQTLVADGLEPLLRGWQRWKGARGVLRSLGSCLVVAGAAGARGGGRASAGCSGGAQGMGRA